MRANARGLRPSVEAMEARLLLSGASGTRPSIAAAAVPVEATSATASANRTYLTQLENALMTGTPSAGRDAALLRQLNAGVPRSRVVSELLGTPEYAASLASGAYRTFLDRAPTAAESRRVAAILRAGGDGRSVFLALASGREYAQVRGGGTTLGFVRALYQDVLGRSPQDGEEQSWVARLNAGAPRTAIIRAFLNSGEALTRQAREITFGTPNAGSSPTLASDALSLRSYGGVNRLVTRVFSSPSSFARATQVDPTTPPPTDTPPLIHPPGLPLAPGLDLGTRWTSLATDSGGPVLDGTNLVTAASDGSIWVTGPSGHRDQLYVLTPANYSSTNSNQPTWRALPRLSYTIQSFSAVSNNRLYAVVTEQTPGFGGLIRVDGQGDAVQVSTPSGLTSVSAATDGTLMAIAGTTVIVRYPGQGTWTTLPAFPADPKILLPSNVSAGSKDNLFAVFSDGAFHFLSQYGSNTWNLFFPTGIVPLNISATSDGALWVWDGKEAAVRSPITGAFQVVNSTIVSDQNGAIKTTPVNAPGAIGVGAAISQNRLVVSLSPNSAGANTVQVLSLGVADQQAVPILPTDPQLLDFYNEISAYLLGTSGGGGIRAVYDTTTTGVLNTYYSKLLGMPAPSDVNPSNENEWLAFQTQIEEEIQDDIAVQGLFASLDLINQDIKTNNNTNLPGIEALVSAGTQPITGASGLSLFLENLFEALLWGLAAAVPAPGSIIGSILASAYGSAISLATNDPNPNSNTTLDVQYSVLSTTLSGLYDSIDTVNLAYETSILSDWSRLTNLGSLLTGPNPVWHPPIGDEQTVADNTEPTWNLFFYQTLMPAKWQVVSIPTYTFFPDYNVGVCLPGRAPYPFKYDLISQFLGYSNRNCPIYSYRFLNQVGSDPDPFASDDGPYPTSTLLQTIYGFGITKRTLFSGGAGFHFQVVAGPSGP